MSNYERRTSNLALAHIRNKQRNLDTVCRVPCLEWCVYEEVNVLAGANAPSYSFQSSAVRDGSKLNEEGRSGLNADDAWPVKTGSPPKALSWHRKPTPLT